MNEDLYNEIYRPQFHFTAKQNWLNDPNGLVYYKGEYHLFFQHNPYGIEWGPMHWGHSVSTDLIHWQELPMALYPDEWGMCFSGSAVVDWNNTTGLQQGREKTLVILYTGAGDPFVQCLAYSNDRGRTWRKYSHNPVLENIAPENRDPKIFWHTPSGKWIMALYVRWRGVDGIHFFSSPNLKQWTFLSKIDGFFECPDIFELPVEGNPENTRWVLLSADGNYLIGHFDGEAFRKESGKHQGDWGAHFYASQTFNDIPPSDGRRIQIAWMRGGKYPGMPFNQQMTFPCELTLRSFPEGIRMCRYPVREIRRLYTQGYRWRDKVLQPGENWLEGIKGDLFDIHLEVELRNASVLGFRIRGEEILYKVNERTLSCLGRSAPLEPKENRLQLRILVDRTSLEVFGNKGRVSMSSCFLPDPQDNSLNLFTVGGSVRVRSLKIYPLRSAWRD